MKKIIIFSMIVTLICNLCIFFPNSCYASCNTVRFTKEVNAVQLILADGKMIQNIKIDKNASKEKVTTKSYKRLKIVFVVNTNIKDKEELNLTKKTVNDCIDKTYNLYDSKSRRKRL